MKNKKEKTTVIELDPMGWMMLFLTPEIKEGNCCDSRTIRDADGNQLFICVRNNEWSQLNHIKSMVTNFDEDKYQKLDVENAKILFESFLFNIINYVHPITKYNKKTNKLETEIFETYWISREEYNKALQYKYDREIMVD